MSWRDLVVDAANAVVVVIVSLVVVLILAARCESQDEWQSLTDAIVRIQAGQHGGSGTLVAVDGQHGYVVTCKHVVGSNQRATAVWRSGYSSTGHVLGTGTAYDTAVIQVTPPSDAVVIPVAEDPAPQDTEVDVFGYGGQHGINVRDVQLIRWRSRVRGYKQLGSEELITLDPHAQSGDSGGPIVYRGQLVGIVSGGQLESYQGRPIDSHGPYCRPIRNLLRALAPHVLVLGGDAIRRETQCPPGTVCPPPVRQPVPRPSLTPVQRSPVPPNTSPISPPLVPVQQPADHWSDLRKSLDAVQDGVLSISDQIAASAKADAERMAAVTQLVESQRQTHEVIRSITDRVVSGISATQEVGIEVKQLGNTIAEATAAATRASVDVQTAASTTSDAIAAVASSIPASVPWWQTALAALGITGPAGAAAVAVAWLLAKRAAALAAARMSGVQGGTPQPMNRPVISMSSRTVAVDSPPPPQQTATEVRFAPYEKDSYARAHAFAQEQISRKYPASITYLEAEKELIKQHLAAAN